MYIFCVSSLIQFFNKMKKWADMSSLSQEFRERIERLERNFEVSTVIFKKFEPIFLDMFQNPQEEPPKIPRSRKQRWCLLVGVFLIKPVWNELPGLLVRSATCWILNSIIRKFYKDTFSFDVTYCLLIPTDAFPAMSAMSLNSAGPCLCIRKVMSNDSRQCSTCTPCEQYPFQVVAHITAACASLQVTSAWSVMIWLIRIIFCFAAWTWFSVTRCCVQIGRISSILILKVRLKQRRVWSLYLGIRREILWLGTFPDLFP